jgi:actin
MSDNMTNYSSIVIDIGSGFTKGGFTGEDGPRTVFSTLVGKPKNQGILVGMEQKEYYVGEEALSKMDIMNFHSPVVNGEIVDWDKYETLLHYLFYHELKVVPEEMSILITESPLNPVKNRSRLAETLFETFNIQKLHIANSSMLGLYSYGLTSGIVIDSGYGVTSSVPVYEGYPLPHASVKSNFGGENLSELLLSMIQSQLSSKYKGIKGKLISDRIKEKNSFILKTKDEDELDDKLTDKEYILPDNTKIKLGSELYKHSEAIFTPINNNYTGIIQLVIDSISKCDPDVTEEIQENICLIGGTTLTSGFSERIEYELTQKKGNTTFKLSSNPERQYASWIGGSIISSLNNFSHMWVTRQNYDEIGNSLEAVESKCF